VGETFEKKIFHSKRVNGFTCVTKWLTIKSQLSSWDVVVQW